MDKIVFFGAGTIGRRMLTLFNEFDVKVSLFLDNSPEKCNSDYSGVDIIKPDYLDDIKHCIFFITCNQENEIREKLYLLGVQETYIRKGNTMTSMLSFLTLEQKLKICSLDKVKCFNSLRESKALIDLQKGLVLGGVESWALQTMKTFEKLGIDTRLLTSNLYKHTGKIEKKKILELNYRYEYSEKRRLEICLKTIIEEKPDIFICNFISYNFFAAINARQEYLTNLKIIAVLHNDEDVYYEGYVTFQESIDCCLVISSLMRDKLMSLGFPKDKIIMLPWKISQAQRYKHQYSLHNEPIKIGYAGRWVIAQKRIDLILKVVSRLKELGISYRLEMAGNGSYEMKMKESIIRQGLEEQVKLIGYVEQKDIMKFWERQDIMLSCSEWEGHSISQCEAMSVGVVPVITDVSGTRDDVEDGYNGFVRPVGDIEGLTESIIFLYQHREKLNEMGKNSFEIIKKKYAYFDEGRFWKKLLEREL